VGGDKVKSYNLVKILYRNYTLKVAVITEEPLTKEIKTFLDENTESYLVFRKSKIACIFRAFLGLFKKEPIQISYYYSKSVHKKIKHDMEDANILIANLIRTAKYVMHEKGEKYLDIVDAIGPHYIEAERKTSSLLWKLLYKIEGKRVLKYERKCVENFNATFFVNRQEAELYSRYGTTEWIPNGVNDNLFKYESNGETNQKIAFFGKMNYRPNVEAVIWYLDNVHVFLPPTYKFLIVGVFPCREIIDKAKKFKNIEITGYVDDPYEILQNCSAIVAPMQTGGGIQNKVLESMALGQINILTEKAANPICGAIDGVHFLVKNDPAEMIGLITDILNDRYKYEHIGNNARQFIMSNYTWEKYEKQLCNLLEDDVVYHSE
jgi:glycosyltransferase involved in cell wall biosynthesis